jgi:hypothetical protein
MRYRVRDAVHGASRISVNGTRVPLETRETNPYRPGGWRVPAAKLALSGRANVIEIDV